MILGLGGTLAAACSSETGDHGDDDGTSTGSGTGGGGGGGTAGSGTATGTATGTGTGGGTATGTGSTVPVCLQACAGPADCATGTGPFDADNYDCDQGHCVYLGCHDDLECQQLLASYVCRDDGYGTEVCTPPCSSPADCDLGAGPGYDADNYDCVAGGCRYLGCNDTPECQPLGSQYVCHDYGTTALCTPGCTSPADCDLGAGAAFDADNYDCTGGVCVYTGCNSTTECQATGNFVCVD